eukprot:m.207887 g.207887  ORF g.207887 m.207887 type:complete len:439 (+) comp18947_c0_seq1:185-1501(+)
MTDSFTNIGIMQCYRPNSQYGHYLHHSHPKSCYGMLVPAYSAFQNPLSQLPKGQIHFQTQVNSPTPMSVYQAGSTATRIQATQHASGELRQRDVEAAEWLMMLSKSPSPDISYTPSKPIFPTDDRMDESIEERHVREDVPIEKCTHNKQPVTPPQTQTRRYTPNSAARKRLECSDGKIMARKRLCRDFSHNIPSYVTAQNAWPQPVPTKLTASETTIPMPHRCSDFMIQGTQGNLPVCVRRVLKRHGTERSYLLVRLRGQSNTLSLDARLNVTFSDVRPPVIAGQLRVHFARVRSKAGALKYDFLSNACTLEEVQPIGGSHNPGSTESRRRETDGQTPAPGRTMFTGRLQQSIFSKKCWSGVVVRGPRMFVAFVEVGGVMVCHSAPMFVEISPTQSTPGYRDPVGDYSDKLVDSFFSNATMDKVARMHHSHLRHSTAV